MSNASSSRGKDGWLTFLYVVMFLASVLLILLGVVEMRNGEGPAVLGMGVLALIVTMGLYPLASAMTAAARRPALPEQTRERLENLLASINDRLLISDAAKRIAYREQDRQALRRAIMEDIEKKDYDAAMVLVHEMGDTYGYKAEAEEFREQINRARESEQDREVTEAIERLEQTLEKRQWEEAGRMAAKIQRLYPESPRVAELDRHVAEAREQYKQQLERRFLEAAQRDDVEQAMELLKEMDRYLSEQEAEPFRETARGVIGKKRQNLGVQFKLAVQDKDWYTAVQVGEEIIREFPNTKFADEARAMMDVLRERAAGQTAAQQSGA